MDSNQEIVEVEDCHGLVARVEVVPFFSRMGGSAVLWDAHTLSRFRDSDSSFMFFSSSSSSSSSG